MKKFIFLLFLVSCSAKNVDKNSNNEFFDFNMDLNFEEFEKLLKDSEHQKDPARRLLVLQEAENILMEEFPAITIYWYTTNYLIDPRVKGWSPLLLNNHPWKWVSFESN